MRGACASIGIKMIIFRRYNSNLMAKGECCVQISLLLAKCEFNRRVKIKREKNIEAAKWIHTHNEILRAALQSWSSSTFMIVLSAICRPSAHSLLFWCPLAVFLMFAWKLKMANRHCTKTSILERSHRISLEIRNVTTCLLHCSTERSISPQTKNYFVVKCLNEQWYNL